VTVLGAAQRLAADIVICYFLKETERKNKKTKKQADEKNLHRAEGL